MNVIKQHLSETGLKQADVVRATGLSATAVSRHINDDRGVSAEAATAYHQSLGLPLDELLKIRGNAREKKQAGGK